MEETVDSSEIEKLEKYILRDFENGRNIDKIKLHNKPNKSEVWSITQKLIQIVYPGYFFDDETSLKFYNPSNSLALQIEDIFFRLKNQVMLALDFCKYRGIMNEEERDEESYIICKEFFLSIPKIREHLETDVYAAFEGDPAAGCYEEVILAYPGLMATTVNLLAHELYMMDVPVIPRLMAEFAHSQTGIDIHPGAKIGKHFFIDHGTGIVIGETTEIGENVKIYQGVTLGALSTREGQKLAGKKRHPTIEDNVTIYAGASILGGLTVIGKNAVIGANAFITTSIPADTRVSIKNQELEYKSSKKAELLDNSEEWYYII